ncbi:ribosomal protein L24 [Neobacillus sp. B4I6]|uniref:hypothetical protein n=1 Tax=Neobacillus sp. B4I6 TaxID=3373925 RepID=UPI003D238C38
MIGKTDLINLNPDDPRRLQFGKIASVFNRTCLEMKTLGFDLVFIPRNKTEKAPLTPQALQIHYDNVRIGAIQYEGHNHIHLSENMPETVSLRFERKQLEKLNKLWKDKLEKVMGPYRKDGLDDKECTNKKAQSIAFRLPTILTCLIS